MLYEAYQAQYDAFAPGPADGRDRPRMAEPAMALVGDMPVRARRRTQR